MDIDKEEPTGLEQLAKARHAACEENWEAGISLYSEALQLLTAEKASEFDPSLGPVYLEYANMLWLAEITEDEEEKKKPPEDSDSDEESGDAGESEEEEEGSPKPGTSKAKDSTLKDNDEEDVEEEQTKLQQAWEVLEVARKIYSDKPDEESKLKLIQVHQMLAQGLSQCNRFEAAISEGQTAIERATEFRHMPLLEASLRMQVAAYWLKLNDYEQATIELDHVRFDPRVQDHPKLKNLSEKLESTVKTIESLDKDTDTNTKKTMLCAAMCTLLTMAGLKFDATIYKCVILKGEEEEEEVADVNMANLQGLGVSSSSAGDAPPAASPVKSTTTIQHLVRRKEPASSEQKKTENGETKPAINGSPADSPAIKRKAKDVPAVAVDADVDMPADAKKVKTADE